MMTKASFDHPGESRDPPAIVIPAEAGISALKGSGRLHEAPAFAPTTEI
jgi:hypothetical protein